jgi:hypothetical protein
MERYKEAPDLLQEEFLTEFRKLKSWEQHLILSSVERVATMMDAQDIDASPILTIGEIGTSSSVA